LNLSVIWKRFPPSCSDSPRRKIPSRRSAFRLQDEAARGVFSLTF